MCVAVAGPSDYPKNLPLLLVRFIRAKKSERGPVDGVLMEGRSVVWSGKGRPFSGIFEDSEKEH